MDDQRICPANRDLARYARRDGVDMNSLTQVTSFFVTPQRKKKPTKTFNATLCALGFALVFTAAAIAADAPSLTFKFTTVDVPGAMETYPGGVNNAGVTVGLYIDKSSAAHGFILNGKKLTRLDHPKGKGMTFANSLNPNGAISVVGAYVNSSGNELGYLYKNGKYSDIPGPPGTVALNPTSINDTGAIVGEYGDSNGVVHGFLLKGKKYTTLDVPGASETVATGIDKNGWIVMYWADSKGVIESSLTKNNGKTYKTINVPGAAGSLASDLDAAGDVTYEWLDSSNLGHGALLHAGKYYKFDHPKGVQTYGGGINDKNLIVGGFQAVSQGPFQGFKAAYK
jgi:hypothetical protein